MDEKARALTAAKTAAGFRAADMVEDGTVIGLGTGSTVFYMIERLSARIREEGLKVSGVPTSYQTAMRAREYGIPLATLDDYPAIDHGNRWRGRGGPPHEPHQGTGCRAPAGEMRCCRGVPVLS